MNCDLRSRTWNNTKQSQNMNCVLQSRSQQNGVSDRWGKFNLVNAECELWNVMFKISNVFALLRLTICFVFPESQKLKRQPSTDWDLGITGRSTHDETDDKILCEILHISVHYVYFYIILNKTWNVCMNRMLESIDMLREQEKFIFGKRWMSVRWSNV